MQLTEMQLGSLHPHAVTVHRRAESLEMIGTAVSGREYTRGRNNKRITVSMGYVNTYQQGISASSFCCYVPQNQTGVFPLTDDLITLGFQIIAEENVVVVQGADYQMVRCFNRSVETAHNITVREALACRGKDDRLFIDQHFTAFFDNSQHCYLCLRSAEEQSGGNFVFINQNRRVQFSNAMFAQEAWHQCEQSFIKIPSAYMSIILAGKNIREELETKRGVSKRVTTLLVTAFNASDEAAIGVVNALIEHCVAVPDIATLPLAFRQTICEVLEELVDELFGMECSEYLDYLKPNLLAEGGGKVGEI
jgi:hypothetical protein